MVRDHFGDSDVERITAWKILAGGGCDRFKSFRIAYYSGILKTVQGISWFHKTERFLNRQLIEKYHASRSLLLYGRVTGPNFTGIQEKPTNIHFERTFPLHSTKAHYPDNTGIPRFIALRRY
jgi:hypothetical protein